MVRGCHPSHEKFIGSGGKMKKMKTISRTGWFIALFLLITSFAHAEMKDLLLHFQPSITVEEEYSDNIYLTSKNRKSDFITTIYPGLRFSTLPRSEKTGQFQPASTSTDTKYGIDLDYKLGLVYYGKEEDNNFVSHRGTLNAWYTLDRRLTFRVMDYLIRSEEGREREYSATALENQYLLSTQRGQRTIYLRNVFEPSMEYQFGKENSVSLNYRNNIYENDSRLYQDSQEDFINPRLSYWFNIRNGVSLEYGLTFGNFDRSPDFIGHMGRGRYTHRFNQKTSLFGDYTYLKRDFDSPSIDYDVHRPTLGIEHAFNPTLSGRAQFGYFWQNPEKGSTTGGFSYDISLTEKAQKTTYTLSFQGGYTEDYFTAENLGFNKYHRAVGTITHRLLERMDVGLSGSFERAKLGDGRTDQIWGVTGNASYELLKWLTLSLDVSHRENHSNMNVFDYSEYRGMFRITATY